VHLRWLDKHLNGVKLQDIKRDLLGKIVADKQSEGVKPSTVNRVMEVVRCILNKAHREWEWIDRVPPVQMLKEPTKRVRWITREEADKLVAELPSHLAVMAEFSLQTGLRRHNVTHLEWSQLDLVKKRAWVHPDQAKAGKAISVPLSDVAVDLIRQQLGKQTGKPSPYVFLYHGAPVYQTSTKAWHDALISVGITKFRWHDLRHTWASWHVQRGTPLPVLKELGGWATYEMVLKYAHLACDHLAEYVNPKPGVATEVATVEEKRARRLA
jgi:integrase